MFILNTYMTIALRISGPMYGGTPPSATSLLRPLFFGPAKRPRHTFSDLKKKTVNTVTR